MTCSPIQPNLWVGPGPRDDEDFKNLRSLNITAVLSLQDEEDRGDGGIESERAAAARVGLAFESVPVKDFSNADLQLRLPKCIAALALLLGQGHSVYVHCTAGVSLLPPNSRASHIALHPVPIRTWCGHGSRCTIFGLTALHRQMQLSNAAVEMVSAEGIEPSTY